MRRLAGLVCAAVVSLLDSSCGNAQCDCAQPGVTLRLPCAAARQQVQSITGAGACWAAKYECVYEDCSGSLEMHVIPDTTGQCEITVLLKDGTVATYDAVITKTTGSCCAGFYADSGHRSQDLPVPGACGDAG